MAIAIIPARGGSKRIPRKNIKKFNGKPMISWSITKARESGLFKHIIVTTDDEEIATIAQEFGAQTPFIRPSELANDSAPTQPVISHAILSCANIGMIDDYICCIYPCAPFLSKKDLTNGLATLKENKEKFVYPVAEYTHPAQRAMLRSNNGEISFLHPENELVRTQDLPKTYHDTGQFYWGTSSSWQSDKKMHANGIGIIVNQSSLIDIDTPDDWKRAELLYKIIEMEKGK